MSFSSEAKKEVLANDKSKRCCLLAEFCAIFAFSGKITFSDGKYVLHITTESAPLARRIYNLIKYNFDVVSKIEILKKKNSNKFYYLILVQNNPEILKILKVMGFVKNNISEFSSYIIDKKIYEKKCCKKAFIKGAFLAGGFVSNPEKNYHLEFAVPHIEVKDTLNEILCESGFSPKQITRKSKHVIYFKLSEDIADILSYIGAFNSLMEIHNTKIIKEMRNNVNRFVNCSTANLDKVVKASMKQIECIELIEKKGKMSELPPSLYDVAVLRLKNKELGLKELGEMLNPPLSKSGVNHRLKKIEEFAQKL